MHLKSLIINLAFAVVIAVGSVLGQIDDQQTQPAPTSLSEDTNSTPPTSESTSRPTPDSLMRETSTDIRSRLKGAELLPAFDTSKKSQYGISARRRDVKIPTKKEKKPKDAWRFSVELGSDTMRGNKNRDRYSGSVEAEKETQENYFWLRARRRYGKSGEEKDVDESQVDARAEHMLTDRDYLAADTQLLQDRISDLTYRLRANVSVGRFFIQSPRTLLGTEVGPGWIQEKKGDEVNGYAAGRLGGRFERLITESVLFSTSAEFIQSAEDAKVYFVNAAAGLRVALSSSLQLEISVEDRYDNAPAEGKKKNDWFTSTSLRWQF